MKVHERVIGMFKALRIRLFESQQLALKQRLSDKTLDDLAVLLGAIEAPLKEETDAGEEVADDEGDGGKARGDGNDALRVGEELAGTPQEEERPGGGEL